MRALTTVMEVLKPYIVWMIGVLGGLFLLLLITFLICRSVMRRKHDRVLEEEAREEETAQPPSALEAEVTVIPPEELPQDENNIFMPVPATVSELIDFVTEEHDHVMVRSCVRAEDADELLTDECADELRAVVYREHMTPQDSCAYLTLDVLSANFAPYSYVNLAVLKKYGLVDTSMTALVIRAEGVLRKPLLIEANEFSLTAVKMISLTGGRAVEIRPAENTAP